jgi:uncharacterized protein (DUF362 family)
VAAVPRRRESAATEPATTALARSPLSDTGLEHATLAIVDDAGLTAIEKLATALDRAGFWDALSGRAPRIVIKPEFAGFSAGSPTVTDPALVECLIDLLHDRGFSDVAVVGTQDSSALWAANRDIYALSDLLGYRFVTPAGRAYDVIDLAEDTEHENVFPLGSALHGTAIASAWLDADFRIVFSKNRTDEMSGYALCLDTLIGVLPLPDKDLHYRIRRHPGDVVAELLMAAPIHFCLIDAITSAHGGGGRRAPEPIDTGTIIAASDIVLADYVGALKMRLDPAVSPIFARVSRARPMPRRYTISGTLTPYPGWVNVPALLLRTTRMRGEAGSLARLVEPWLQRLDLELFPLRQPIDAKANSLLAGFFADTDTSPTSQSMLVLANLLLGLVGRAIESYRVLFAKDALHRQAVPLGIDLAAVSAAAFDDLVAELKALEPIAAIAPPVSEQLRWRTVDDAILFNYATNLSIDYELFISRVDIARTIQFMNDYLGGVVVPLAHDHAGRPVRQAERNVYLPQPNYLVLYQGKPIDVSKLEVVEYGTNQNRLYWKTINSENGSAIYDDGIATFQRTPDGTRVTIMGRQKFVLPLFWQVFDLDLVPELKAVLATHAYQTFFDRTVANFEALVEGRDIRIGSPADEPAVPPMELLLPWLQKFGEIVMPLLQTAVGKAGNAPADEGQWTDADGFTHVIPKSPDQPPALDERVALEIQRFVDGLSQAMQRDLVAGPAMT